MTGDTMAEIERILRAELRPVHLEIVDESHRHVGHPGASSGGGHYRVEVVSELFEGRTLLEQHRRVNDALRELFGEKIHALALKTVPPSRWRPPEPTGS